MLTYGLPHYWLLLFVLIVAIAAVVLLPVLDWANAKLERRAVIVYTSQDQVYAEPIFREFQRQTGIKVRAVYDSEAVKTVGLANRLLAEKSNPQADVFWSNEELRTRQLAAQGIFRENDPLLAFGHRSRRIVVNTNLLPVATAPRTLTERAPGAARSRWHIRSSARPRRTSSRYASTGAGAAGVAARCRRTSPSRRWQLCRRASGRQRRGVDRLDRLRRHRGWTRKAQSRLCL